MSDSPPLHAVLLSPLARTVVVTETSAMRVTRVAGIVVVLVAAAVDGTHGLAIVVLPIVVVAAAEAAVAAVCGRGLVAADSNLAADRNAENGRRGDPWLPFLTCSRFTGSAVSLGWNRLDQIGRTAVSLSLVRFLCPPSGSFVS